MLQTTQKTQIKVFDTFVANNKKLFHKRPAGNLTVVFLSFFILIFCSPFTPSFAEDKQSNDNSAFADAVNALNAKSFKAKADAIKIFETINNKQTINTLKALLESRLFYRKSDQLIVITTESENGYHITDAITENKLGEVGKRDIKKIRVNNKLRKQLRGTIAQLSLSNEDTDIRLNAVSEITKILNQDTIDLLRSALEKEKNDAVNELIHLALALWDINSADKNIRLKAISLLGDSLSQEARSKLSKLLDKAEDGTFLLEDAEIRNAAKKALIHIDSQLDFYALIEKIFFGLSLGSVLLLAAIGLAITFGVMGVINMAHGELIMIGAYTTYVVQLLMPDNIALSIFVAIPAAFIVSGLFGIAIERSVIRHLYGRPLETLLATFGVSLVLQQLVRSIFSPLNQIGRAHV